MGDGAGPGLEVYANYDIDEQKYLVKTGPGIIYGYHLFNDSAGSIFVKVYDAAATGNVTVGTTTPKMVLGLPAGSGACVYLEKGVRFRLGIVLAATTGSGASDTTAPSANDVAGTFWFD